VPRCLEFPTKKYARTNNLQIKNDLKFCYCINNKMLLEDLLSAPKSGYSGYFIGKNNEELDSWIGKQFSRSSDIKNLKKKKLIQGILEKFKNYFESLLEEKHSFQFFVSDEESKFYELDKNQIKIIQKYHKKDEFLFDEEQTNIDYWKDFYFNDKFYSVYEVKDSYQHYYFTKTKFEERDRLKPDFIREYLTKFPADLFIGDDKNKLMEGYKPVSKECQGKNKHDQLLNAIQEFQQIKENEYLDKILVEMVKNPDKFLFGNEIVKGIQNYEIKEIFCFPEFKEKLEFKLPKELFNFTWHIYPKSESKLEEYRGIFAIKYY